MSFDKATYWAEKIARKQFQEDWAIWRRDLISRLGSGTVHQTPWLFTQAAYREYLDFKSMQAEQALQQATNNIDLSQPPDRNLETEVTIPPDLNNKIESDSSSIPGISTTVTSNIK